MDEFSGLNNSFELNEDLDKSMSIDLNDVDAFAEDTLDFFDIAASAEQAGELSYETPDAFPEDTIEGLEMEDENEIILTPQEVEIYIEDLSDPEQLRTLRDAIASGQIQIRETEELPDSPKGQYVLHK